MRSRPSLSTQKIELPHLQPVWQCARIKVALIPNYDNLHLHYRNPSRDNRISGNSQLVGQIKSNPLPATTSRPSHDEYSFS